MLKSIATGYTSYHWSPSFGLNNTTTNTVRIFNSIDTLYTISVTREPGCILTDSFSVNNYQSIPINLTGDTSICTGTTLVLSTQNVFKNVVWNTGDTGRAIIITNPGEYSLIAKDSNDCVSKDTFRLINSYPLSVVNLGRDTAICRGSAYVLSPGSFSKYLWQDSSTNFSFSITDTGNYWVRVADNHYCVNSDSLRVTNIKEPSINFLPD